MRLIWILLSSFVLALPAIAQPPKHEWQPTAQQRGSAEATGIHLETIDYGYPSQTFSFDRQGQRLQMSYMDVVPTGEANGDTIVLLHGKNFNGDYWTRTAGDLAVAGYRVVIPDQIGFGKSSKPLPFHYTFHGMAADTVALLDELGVGDVHVVGHSMGGMLATRLSLVHPGRVETLSLVNPIGLEDWRQLAPWRPVEDWYDRELNKSFDTVKAYMRANYYDGNWDPAYDRGVELLLGPTASPDYPRVAWTQAMMFDVIFTQPVVHEFADLQMPTLLIVGARDRTALGKDLVTKEQAAEMGRYDRLGKQAAEAIPDATLVEFDDVGHMPHLENYDAYIAALTEFLAR